MCGIAGILDRRPNAGGNTLVSDIVKMRDALTHRGPDSKGEWCDVDYGLALGHRRLSIIDLTDNGHQPMVSNDGRFVLVFNGEIYNYRELRQQLITRGHEFNGDSDTEVLLAAISEWGFESALSRSRGMFALSLWDRHDKSLFLARDRLGEKPLYYHTAADLFLFASELKAFHPHPRFSPGINRDALSLYFRHNYVPAPHTIYERTYQLLPGTWIEARADGSVSDPKAYWSLTDRISHAIHHPFRGSMNDAVIELESRLVESVRNQMISDVPLGAMLSGGIDSSCIVAMMQQVHSMPVRTFSVAYDEGVYNEADHAAAIARHLHTDHTELHVRASDALELIPSLPALYDEPFADASQLPTTLISRLTRQYVTVALTGDGGDEVFGGYNRYFWASRIHRSLGLLPYSIRKLLAAAMSTPSVTAWDRIYGLLSPAFPDNLKVSLPGDKVYKLASVLHFRDKEDLYRQLVSHWSDVDGLVIGGHEPSYINKLEQDRPPLQDYSRRMMYLDTRSYLPNDILTKVDRAAMSCGLETRVPFLDHHLVEFAWSLPAQYLINNGQGKHILRQVLYKHVPRKLLERPKMGFGVPIDQWLRGPLRDWAENLLDSGKIREEGLLNWEPIGTKWKEHISGHRNWQYHLWSILMFQAWHEQWS